MTETSPTCKTVLIEWKHLMNKLEAFNCNYVQSKVMGTVGTQRTEQLTFLKIEDIYTASQRFVWRWRKGILGRDKSK